MAKSTNGLGKFSGKLGASVFAIRNGQQIIREKPVVVSNPKSQLQKLQRAKANLVGQISKIVPYQILTALGDNRSARRSRFLRLALNGATSSVSVSNPSEIVAKLDSPDFVFAEGALVPTMYVSTAAAGALFVDITLRRYAEVSDADFLASGALVVVTILTTAGTYESVLYRYVDASEFNAEGLFSFTMPHINEGAYAAGVYIAPFTTTDGKALRARANDLFGEGSDFAAAMVYNPSVLPLVWGRSVFVGERDFAPTTTTKENSKKK